MGMFSEIAEEMREEQQRNHEIEIARIKRSHDLLFTRHEKLQFENEQLELQIAEMADFLSRHDLTDRYLQESK